MRSSDQTQALDIESLRRAYRDGTTNPVDLLASVASRISGDTTEGIWTHVRSVDEVVADARALGPADGAGAQPPLYGVPFAVKDNIDVGGLPTTAGCREFWHVPAASARVVELLCRAGAVCVGKSNLDQFATGLVGVRSPYGVPPNPFDSRYVSGGSSSGSAAAVTRGLVSFALATDTAGSGRVPAAFNLIVGFKPSRGLLSTRGLLPACRSADCISVMSLTCRDAREVAELASGFDPQDPYSRHEAARFDWRLRRSPDPFRAGVPRAEDLSGCDPPTLAQFERAREQLAAMGASLESVDLTPFFEAGRLLYEGPWIAERLSALEPFTSTHHDALLPVIRAILATGQRYSATDVFRGQHRLAELRREIEPLWGRIDALVLPSAPMIPRIDEVLADPLGVNARLGAFTTFGNLLDLAAVAVPSGLRSDGLPSGVTFVGPWGRDPLLLALASAFHARGGGSLGATGWPWPHGNGLVTAQPRDDVLPMAVVGAHLTGMPLNRQLVERGARLVRTAHTAPSYRLYALPNTEPPKPGLVRVASGQGVPIELEMWALPLETVGSFLSGVGAPLAIGTIDLEDGTRVHGFLCEGQALEGATDISSFGGWRAYVSRSSAGRSR